MIMGFMIIVILALIIGSFIEQNEEAVNNYNLSRKFDKTGSLR